MSDFVLDAALKKTDDRLTRLELAVARNKPAAGIDFNDDGGDLGGGVVNMQTAFEAFLAGLAGAYLTTTLGGQGVVQALGTLGATETIDLANANKFWGTLDQDCTITTTGWTNLKDAQISVELIQDGTGGWTPTFTGVTWIGGTPTWITTAGTVTHVVLFSRDGGTTIYGAVVGAGSGSASHDFPTFWVTDYGAIEDNTTNCQTAVNAAIAAMNAAGGGRLYFPGSGVGYLTTGAFDAITVPGIVMGDGIAATIVNCSSATANLFTTSTATRAPSFRDMSIINTHATPTAGAGIRVLVGNYGHYARLRMENWWVGIRHEDGAAWGVDAVTMNSIRKYGLHISNADEDEGDWFISNSAIVASTHSPDAAIRIDSSGGGRISNCKINGSDPTTGYNHGVDLAIAGTDATSILLISNCSIENLRGDAVHVTQTDTATYSQIIVTGCQISLASNNAGKAVSIVAEDAGGISFVVVTGNIFATDGTARTPITLTKVDNADIRGNLVVGNFTNLPLYTQSASTAVAAYYPGAQLDYAQITSPVNITGTTEAGATTIVTGNAVTFDGVGSYVITFYSPAVSTPSAASQDAMRIWLFEDGSSIGRLGLESTTAAAVSTKSVLLQRHLTPTAGSHTYSIRAHVNVTTGTPVVNAGAGGSGAYMPAFIRITKA